MGPIEQMWLDYERRVLPANSGAVQRKETRKAFYAGAMCLFERLVTMLDPEAEPTEADVRKMNEINNEILAWLEEMAAGVRGSGGGS